MNKVFQRGEAVHFHHLHDNRPALLISGPDKDGECKFEIEGKARKMLILGQSPLIRVETAIDTRRKSGRNDCTFYAVEGRLGYLVLSLQHSPPPGEYLKCPDLLGDGTDSFVALPPQWYPAKSVSQWENQPPTQVSPKRLMAIEQQLNAMKLGCSRAIWHRAGSPETTKHTL